MRGGARKWSQTPFSRPAASARGRRGDLFEIVFIQIKGGRATWPTVEDMRRMRAVQRRYRARAVVLAVWDKGAEPTFHVLEAVSANREPAWRQSSAADVFGVDPRTKHA